MEQRNSKIRVAIADDHQIFRKGVILSLRQYDDIEFVLEAENGLQLLEGLKFTQPDVILVDLRMPVMDGIEAIKHIRRMYPHIYLFPFTMFEDERFVLHTMQNGANGYLLKNTEPAEVRRALQEVMAKGYYLNNFVNRILLKHSHSQQTPEVNYNLTKLEIDVLRLLCMECSINEISVTLATKVENIESARANLFNKLGVNSVGGLVYTAIDKRLVLEEDIEIKSAAQQSINGFLVSNSDIAKLYSLSTSILKYINHDLKGQKTTLRLLIQQMQVALSEKNSAHVAEKIDNAFIVLDEMNSVNDLIKNHFYWKAVENKGAILDQLFITKLSDIVNILKTTYKHVKISTEKKSQKKLRIIYPPSVLLAICLELVKNAKKERSSSLEILLKWYIAGSIFHFEVHDSGPGFPGTETGKFMPLDVIETSLKSEKRGIGLATINRTIMDSGGMILFSRSKRLHGAVVQFTFPVLNFWSK